MWLLINLAMELLCLNLVTLALVLRLNSVWASQFSWSFLLIWGGGVISTLVTWIFVLYIPRTRMSFYFPLLPGLLIYLTSEQGSIMRTDSTFVLHLFQTYGGFMSPLLLNTLFFLVFSLQKLSTLRGVSFCLTPSWHTPDTPMVRRITDTAFLHVLLTDSIVYCAVTLGASLLYVLVR
jgi:hypothetical protein